MRTIFQQGTSWANITEEDALVIIGAIPELPAGLLVSRKGACSDAKINSLLGHIAGVTTDIIGMDEKVLNQQRALWITPDKARNIMVDHNIKLQEELRIRKDKEDAKELAIVEKRRAVELRTVLCKDGRRLPLLEWDAIMSVERLGELLMKEQ